MPSEIGVNVTVAKISALVDAKRVNVTALKTALADAKKVNAIAGVNVVKTAPADVKKINVIVAKMVVLAEIVLLAMGNAALKTALAVVMTANLVPAMTNATANLKNVSAKKVAKLNNKIHKTKNCPFNSKG